MSKKYCSSCGTPNETTASNPVNFCGKCGQPLNAAFKRPVIVAVEEEEVTQQPRQQIKKKVVAPTLARFKTKPQYQVSDDEDDNNDFEIIIPDASDATVVVNRKLTVGQLQSLETPIIRGSNPEQGLPKDVEVTSKNPFANLE